MNNIYNLIARAHELRKETQLGSISPERVGSILEDTCKYLNEAQIFADSLVHKVYESEEDFFADTEHLSDLTGKPMKAGSIIYIRSNDTFYRYDGGNTKTVLKENALDQLLSIKADKDGVYPDLTAGDLAGRGESVPAEFGFRASGGKSIKDGRAYIKRIKGNSVVWNQKYPDDWTYTLYGITSTSINGLVSIKGTAEQVITQFYPFTANELNHKYLFVLSGASSQLEGKYLALHNRSQKAVISSGFAYLFYKNTDASKGRYFGLSGFSVGDVISENNIRVNQYDLTQMFQAGNEPTTIEEFNARVATLGVDMNAYNEGQVIHCNTESIKSVGDNAWDEEWRNGHYSSTTGGYNNSSQSVCNTNPIKVLPNQKYYNGRAALGSINAFAFFYDADMNFISFVNMIYGEFTSPANAAYMNFYFTQSSYGTTYNHDIMISLVHSGWKKDTDAGYQPYWQDTLPVPIISNYFPQGMKSAGAAHDEVYYDKMQNKKFAVQRIGQVNAWELKWTYNAVSENYPYGFLYAAPTDRANGVGNLLCDKYITLKTGAWTKDSVMFGNAANNLIYVVDSAYTDAASFKAMLQEKQVVLYYELKTPVVTELDAEDQNFRDYYNVADFGTEMSQSSVPSAPFSADIIYQFNAVDMIREHELEITELQKVIATMQAQLDILTNKEEILE